MLTEDAVRRRLEQLKAELEEERQTMRNNKGYEPEEWQESRRSKIIGLAWAIGELKFVLNEQGND